MNSTHKKMFKKYWHILFILYAPVYMISFLTLEKINTADKVTILHMPLDDMIPFCEYFIIPYLLWFVYIAAVLIFFFFYSQKEFVRYAAFLVLGMSISLVIYAIFPNGINLRPETVNSNIFGYLVNMIYTADTSTNVFPSLHCLNSFASHIAIRRCAFFKNRPILIRLSAVLVILICLSTLFLKQHSVYDLLGAIVMAVILYFAVYVLPYKISAGKEAV